MLPDKAVLETIERLTRLEQRVSQLEADQMTGLAGESTYTPASPAGTQTNIDALIFYDTYYIRFLDKIFVFGMVNIDPTAASSVTIFHIDVPVATTFASVYDAVGSFFRLTGVDSGIVRANAVDNDIQFQLVPSHASSIFYVFSFIYAVL